MTVKFEDLEVGDTVVLGENGYDSAEKFAGNVINRFEPGTPGIVKEVTPSAPFPVRIAVREDEEWGRLYLLEEIEEVIGA